ncbi:DUF2332 family protein [Phenylobacterium sp. NIBR 498073]|uniref:DUF2332 domain-containing protein n=1 Tax=Phenylobacterium sp. NIBR 498073 TaxID=3015177 RepID=UPI0022B443E1|nr:DUF2332 family protein [Phenylobacterium sp. NIBR 498073]WGU41138.1 DUF2332 family protein [Phenylobacterium sp. NIBR 498073]
MDSALAPSLRLQAKACLALGSPLHAGVLDLAADDLEAGGPTARLLAPWTGQDLRALMAAAVPLRLLGALHDLVLSGEDPALADAYPQPGKAFDAGSAWRQARRAMAQHGDRLAAFMDHEPQTNEVRRSAALLGGFLTVARETGLPLRCFEIAASAGLNLSWDRYRYDLSGSAWGPDSPVLLPSDWSGALPPLDAQVRVVHRQACDRRPVDLKDPVQRRRLVAYVWPDQFDRLERIRAAIDVALANDVNVEAADAVDWTARSARPSPGAATVIYHSVFWQYMPAVSQAALRQAIEYLGASATNDAPLAWLRMEPPPENTAIMEVRLTIWPGGEERILAVVHAHGASARWTG